MEPQKTSNIQRNLEKKKAVGVKFPDFRLYYKAVVIETVWHQHKNRHTDQWNRIESPDMVKYAQIIFNKGGKSIPWRKDSLFFQ